MYRYKNHTEEQIEKIKKAAEVMIHNPHMTQKELGELFGVSSRTIRAWVKSYEYIDIKGYNKIKDNFKALGNMGKKLGEVGRMRRCRRMRC